MKEIKTICTCDCCKKEVSSEEDLIVVKLPYQLSINTTGSFISWEMINKYKEARPFEICQECAKKIVEGYRKYIDVTDLPYKGWNIELKENLPTVEAESIKCGRWIKMSDADGIYYACSECGNELPRVINSSNPQFDLFSKLKCIDKTTYCPNCGAKMDEKETR